MQESRLRPLSVLEGAWSAGGWCVSVCVFVCMAERKREVGAERGLVTADVRCVSGQYIS